MLVIGGAKVPGETGDTGVGLERRMLGGVRTGRRVPEVADAGVRVAGAGGWAWCGGW